MSDIESILAHLDEGDRQRFTQSVSDIGKVFEAQTGVAVSPENIVGLSAVRDHVLTGGEIPLDLDAAVSQLKGDPAVSTALIRAQVKTAEANRIANDIDGMSRQQKMTYARANGLDRPRADTTSSMTRNEHDAVLAQLSPQQRMNYARKHGLV